MSLKKILLLIITSLTMLILLTFIYICLNYDIFDPSEIEFYIKYSEVLSNLSTILSLMILFLAVFFAMLQAIESQKSRNFTILSTIFNEMHSSRIESYRRYLNSRNKSFDNYLKLNNYDKKVCESVIQTYQTISFFAKKKLVNKNILLQHFSGAYSKTWILLKEYVYSIRKFEDLENYAKEFEEMAAISQAYRRKKYEDKIKIPKLSDKEINHITEVTFGEENLNNKSQSVDAIFIFGSTHPGCWDKAQRVYEELKPKYIFISGGHSLSMDKHFSWNYGDISEAKVTLVELVARGIPYEVLVLEEKPSTNSLENINNMMDKIRAKEIKSLACISKNYAAGRQRRTIEKNLPEILITMYPYDTSHYKDKEITRNNWFVFKKNKKLVLIEYLKNILYSQRNDIKYDFTPLEELEYFIEKNLKNIRTRK